MSPEQVERPEWQPLPPPLAYMKDVLREYYREHVPKPPARFGRREFGFIFWPNRPGPPPFVRHLGFSRRADFEDVFARRVPWHAYYSTAFYQKPSERRMQDKGWLGAELIFDLDADHLPDAKQMSFSEQLAAVKIEFKKLLDEFIFGDFGFTEDDVFLTFSGGRGYHCHVLKESVLALDSKGRRQIADYVTGKGVEERELIRVNIHRHRRGRMEHETKHLQLPGVTEPGWRGRIGRGAVEVLTELAHSEWEEGIRTLTQYDGIGPVTAEKILGRLRNTVRDAAGRTWIDRLAEGMGDQGDAVRTFLSKEAVQRGVVEIAEGETDEPVTADIKRLIRLPDSLHGKSGLRVVELAVDELDAFDPLVDGVALPAEPQDVVMAQKPVSFELKGETFHIPENDPVPLPCYAAFFAVARRLAVPAETP